MARRNEHRALFGREPTGLQLAVDVGNRLVEIHDRGGGAIDVARSFVEIAAEARHALDRSFDLAAQFLGRALLSLQHALGIRRLALEREMEVVIVIAGLAGRAARAEDLLHPLPVAANIDASVFEDLLDLSGAVLPNAATGDKVNRSASIVVGSLHMSAARGRRVRIPM